MDHGWDGFYTSQKRLQRFPIMVETGFNHTVRFEGTPPKEMRFGLRAGDDQEGIKVKIPYPNPGVYSIRANGEKVPPMDFDDQLGHPKQLPRETCGENRFQNDANWLEFFITPGCEILIKPLDAIVGAVRMQWTMEEFWAEGGVTTFADRLASILDIHPSRVHTIQVYEGSVCVQFTVTEEDPDPVVPDPENPDAEPPAPPVFDKNGTSEMLL
jgi:hypothetical protein